MMKKLYLAIGSVALLFMFGSGYAATIMFSGSDIVAQYSLPTVTVGTPVVGDGYVDTTSLGTIRTYNNGSDPVNPTAFNDWLSSLSGSGQGISGFNLWLMGGLSDQAAWWGETLALADPMTAASNIHPFASSGWTAYVYTMGNQWSASWAGAEIISFRADSAADYLRPGTTATFGFTADVANYEGGTGPNYQIWVGAGNASQSDNGEDQLAGVNGGIYFQRAITATVPEPSSLALLGFGLAGLGFSRRRKA